MTTELPENLYLEAIKACGFSESDYFAVSEKFKPETIRFYLELAFSVGYNEGLKHSVAHSLKSCYAENDSVILGFDSIRDAARKMKCNHANIIRAIKTGKKCAGYSWKFV